MSNILGRPTELTAFNKAGIAVTNAAGIAYVIFRTAQPYNFTYVVSLTCAGSTVGGETVVAYPTEMTANGFIINTYRADNAAAMAGVTVHWMVRSAYNE